MKGRTYNYVSVKVANSLNLMFNLNTLYLTSIYLSICLSVYLPTYLPTYLPIYLRFVVALIIVVFLLWPLTSKREIKIDPDLRLTLEQDSLCVKP